MHFTSGDKAGRLTFELPDPDAVEGATLADGFTFAGSAVTDAVLDGDTFSFTSVGALPVGLIQVRPRFSFPDGGLHTIELEPVVVESTLSTWVSIDRARQEWDSAPYSDAQLWRLLDLAQTQVDAYAPFYTSVTDNLLAAQLAQARNLWNAARVDPSNAQLGEGQFTIRPFPMDWTVKNMIRPKRAIPSVA